MDRLPPWKRAFLTASKREKLIEDRLSELWTLHARVVAEAHAGHRAEVASARMAWEQNEAWRGGLRDAFRSGDAGPFAGLLRDAFSATVLPFQTAFEIEVEDLRTIRITWEVPRFDEVPDRYDTLTAAGNPTTKAISQRDRVSIYSEACCGIALRLTADCYTSLPFVQQVEIRATMTDPSTGQRGDVVVLHLATTRERFSRLDLDGVQPLAALLGLTGQFRCDSRGALTILPEITRDHQTATLIRRELALAGSRSPEDALRVSGVTAPVAQEDSGELEADEEAGERDKLFRQAAELCVQHQGGSTSLLQRRMRIGYGRAARVIDQLDRAGILGPPDGSKPREILIDFAQIDSICGDD